MTALAAGTVTATATDADGISAATGPISFVATAASIVITPNAGGVRQFFWVRFSASGGAGPYTYSLSNSSAGFINSRSGWFRAIGAVGAGTEVIATDANGNVGQSGAIVVIRRRR